MFLQSAVEKEQRGKRCQYEALVDTVHNVWKGVTRVQAFKNCFDKIPLIYNNLCRSMGGNNLVQSNRGSKARSELQRAEDVPRQTGVHLVSSSIDTSDEVIYEYQGEDNDKVVDFIYFGRIMCTYQNSHGQHYKYSIEK